MFSSKLIKTQVTSVLLLKDYVFAAIGNQLHVFLKNGTFVTKRTLLQDQSIHTLSANTDRTKLLIHGGTEIKVVLCQWAPVVDFFDLACYHAEDWVLASKWIESDNCIATVSMHNVVSVWTAEMVVTNKVICDEKCILYSAFLCYETWNELVVLSGTVFSEVLIWKPSNQGINLLHRLKGHKGVIFSLYYNPGNGLIGSTSDDRSAVLWSVENNKSLSKPDTKITLKCTMYGHKARVFKCEILERFIITAGEDSTVNIWDLNGQLKREIETNVGNCVWAINGNEQENIVVTGNGDGSITTFPLVYKIDSQELKLDTSKKIGILKNANMISISESGSLDYYRTEWSNIGQYNQFKSYALLEVSPCRNLFALAGYYGCIYIFKQTKNVVDLHCYKDPAIEGRVYSLHWLCSKRLLTCGPDGIISLWSINNEVLLFKKRYILPPGKEQWSTAACSCGPEHYIVGNRKGNLYLFSMSEEHPLQVIKRAHNYLGVTALVLLSNEIISLGRNSEVKKFNYDPGIQQLVLISSDKLPFTWLASCFIKNNILLLLGFNSTEFVIWDHNHRSILFKFKCGGGHRSWDFCENLNTFYFAYLKSKVLNLISFNELTLTPINILQSFHAKEVNSLKIFCHFPNRFLFVSGGEDTTLKISEGHFVDDCINFSNLSTLKRHLSSIKATLTFKIESGKDVQKYLIFSAGGRAQMIMWEVVARLNNNLTDLVCTEKYSYYEPIGADESEIRIMDLCKVEIGLKILLFAGCSDGTIKVFLVDHIENRFALVSHFLYKTKCIMKVASLKVGECSLLLSMATDGKIVFWNITSFLVEINNNSDNTFNKQPFYFIQVHQSGINSFHSKQYEDDKCLIVTGGDDNAIKVTLIRLITDEFDVDVKVLSQYENIAAHCAQITGVFIFENYILTTSVDQKLIIFNLDRNNNKVNCAFIQKYNSVIADIHGMEVFESQNSIYVVVYGSGFEICGINKKLLHDSAI